MNPARLTTALRTLRDRIETALDDEHRDSQYLLEQVSDDLSDLITALESR